MKKPENRPVTIEWEVSIESVPAAVCVSLHAQYAP